MKWLTNYFKVGKNTNKTIEHDEEMYTEKSEESLLKEILYNLIHKCYILNLKKYEVFTVGNPKVKIGDFTFFGSMGGGNFHVSVSLEDEFGKINLDFSVPEHKPMFKIAEKLLIEEIEILKQIKDEDKINKNIQEEIILNHFYNKYEKQL